MPIREASAKMRQGELVFAFGSPKACATSVTMGVVSAVARQPDPDSPLVYVQTDAPINPGNSGGPLVNGVENSSGSTPSSCPDPAAARDWASRFPRASWPSPIRSS